MRGKANPCTWAVVAENIEHLEALGDLISVLDVDSDGAAAARGSRGVVQGYPCRSARFRRLAVCRCDFSRIAWIPT